MAHMDLHVLLVWGEAGGLSHLCLAVVPPALAPARGSRLSDPQPLKGLHGDM